MHEDRSFFGRKKARGKYIYTFLRCARKKKEIYIKEKDEKSVKFYIIVAKKTKLLSFLLPIFLMASGGYDHGTSAGKGNWDISLTWNPFNYFEQGQSYVVLGYGLTKRLDIHGYYSATHNGGDNYYGGLS